MNGLNNESGYIQLSNDRSHLIEETVSRKPFAQKPFLDNYDLVMILGNFIILAYILFNFFKHKKIAQSQNQKDIILPVSDKNTNEFPFFQVFRKKPRHPTLKKTQAKQQNPNQNQNAQSSHNLVELKCTKCNYTTQIYEKNILNKADK